MSVAGKWLDCQTVSIDQLTSKWGETPHRDPRTQHVVHLVPSAAVLLCTFSSSWMELSSVTKHRWIPHHFLWPEALSLLLLHSVVCGKFRSPWSNFDQASLGPWTLHGPRNLRQPQSVLRCGSVVHIIMERVLALLLRVVGVRYLSWVLSKHAPKKSKWKQNVWGSFTKMEETKKKEKRLVNFTLVNRK